MTARRKRLVFAAAALCVVLAGCKDITFNRDMKGYLEYWTATLGVSNPQVSQGYQIDSSGRMTVSTGESVTVTATVENPDGHAVNGGVGPSSDTLKSVRISGAAGDIALSSGPRITVSPTSLTLELPPLSPVPTEATRRAEHKDFTVLLAPVRTENNMSPSSPLSLTLRYNTPPRMPLAVMEDGSGGYRWPKDGDRWEVSNTGKICWAWPKDKVAAGGCDPTDPDYAAYFSIDDNGNLESKAEATLLQHGQIPPKDGMEYNVYVATGLAPSASVKVYAEDGDRVRGRAAVSGPIHTITLHGNGGTFGNGSVSTATMYAGDGSTIKAGDLETPSYPGLSLSGWSEQSSGGQSIAFPHTVSANLTLYAQWRGNSYTVTFDDNSGTGGPGSLTAAYNQTPPSLPSRPTRTGYTFGGYFTERDGGGTEYYDGSGTPQGTWREPQPTTLHAKWTANTYTVEFDANGGTGGPGNVTATYDGQPPAISPPLPTKDGGYTFAGYNTKQDGTGIDYYDASGVSVGTWQEPKNTTLYVQWDYEAPKKDVDGKYQVANAGNLLWIAEQVKSGAEKGANITLTADIKIPDNEWQPIGTMQQKYTGTFDGGNYTINLGSQALTGAGDVYGLFGNVDDGARVQNLILEGDVTMNRTSAGANNHYGVVAYVSGNTTVTNVHSKVNLTIQDSFDRATTGGIVGSLDDGNTLTIERCSFSGTIDAGSVNVGQFGGILAYRHGSLPTKAILKDCLFDGEIKAHLGHIGGLVGYSRTTGLTVKDCLVVGKITASDYEMVGYIAGLILQHDTANQDITNNYYRDHGVPGLNSFGDAQSNQDLYSNTDDIGEFKGQTREGSATKATEDGLKDNTILGKLNASGSSSWEYKTGAEYPTLKNP